MEDLLLFWGRSMKAISIFIDPLSIPKSQFSEEYWRVFSSPSLLSLFFILLKWGSILRYAFIDRLHFHCSILRASVISHRHKSTIFPYRNHIFWKSDGSVLKLHREGLWCKWFSWALSFLEAWIPSNVSHSWQFFFLSCRCG